MTQRERQDRSRQEILNAALAEFGNRDYGQINMEGL